MSYPTYIIAEHDTSFQENTIDGGLTYHWYSLSDSWHEIQPRFANPDNAKAYVVNTLKGIPARVGEAVNIEYYTAILDGNAAAAQAAIQAEQQRVFLQEQQQLQAKTAMLQSPTAQWSSQDAYKGEVAETSAEIRAYNADVAAFLATAPGQPGVTDDALLKKPAAQSQPATAPGSDKSNAGKALLVAAGVAAGIVALAIAAGRD